MDLPTSTDIAHAKLPAAYEAAKVAVAECARVDECKTWSDRAAAIASYAKQADDKELEKTARRIRARAIKRGGELLKQFSKGVGRPKKNGGGTPTISQEMTQREVAASVGWSKDQEVQAVRAANVPDDKFEEMVERDDPATITEIAEEGTKKDPVMDAGPPPQGYRTHDMGHHVPISPAHKDADYFPVVLDDWCKQLGAFNLDTMIAYLPDAEEDRAVRRAETLVEWLSGYIKGLRDRDGFQG